MPAFPPEPFPAGSPASVAAIAARGPGPCLAYRYYSVTLRSNRSLGPAPLPLAVRVGRRYSAARFADGSAVEWDRRSGEVRSFVFN